MVVELNYDVLALLFAVIPARKDLLSLMNTCKILYTAGVPSLLRYGVHITRAKAMQSLHQFLFADESRFKNLVELTFYGNTELNLVIEILRHATCLSTLSVWDWASEPESDHLRAGLEETLKQLQQTIQNMTSLRYFAMSSYQDDIDIDAYSQFLASLQSPLVQFTLYTFGVSVDNTELDLYDLIAPYSKSLKKATLGGFGNLRNSNAHQHTSLRSLTLYPHGTTAIYMQTLVQAFPNLKELYINRQLMGLARHSVRGQNQTAQLSAKWRSLDVLGGAIPELYDLGIVCPVYKLDLRHSMCFSDVTDLTMSQLRRLVEDTHAREIDTEQYCSHLPALLDVLLRVPSGTASVVKITASLSYAGLDSDSVVSFLRTLSSGPTSHSMSYLRITLKEGHIMMRPVRGDTVQTVGHALKQLDIADYVERIAQHNPSLKQLVLEVSGHPTYCVEVSGEGERRATSILSAQEGYEPLARLGLITEMKS